MKTRHGGRGRILGPGAHEDRRRQQVTYAVLVASVVAFMLTQSTVNPVLPRIQAELDSSQNTVTWVMTANLLAASVATPLMGRLGDAYGRKRMLVVAVAALSVGALLAAVAPNIGVMIAARVIQGIGGGTMPLAFGLVRDHFEPRSVSGRVGLLASLGGVGLASGLVVAGPIVEHLGYTWLFLLPALVTAVVALAAWLYIPASEALGRVRLPWLPAILLSGSLVLLLLGISQAPRRGWLSAPILVSLVGGVLLAVTWVVSELRAPVPLVDMRLMRRRAVWTTNLIALLVGAGMYSVQAFLPAVLQTPSEVGYGFSASVTHSGLMLLPFAVMSFVGGVIAASVLRRCGPRVATGAACVTASAGLATLGLLHDEVWQIFIALALVGLGFGLVYAALSSLVVGAVPASQTGVAAGMNANIRTIGGSIGVAAMSSIVTAKILPSGFPVESAYTTGFLVLAGVTAVAAVCGLLVPAQVPPPGVIRPEPVPGDPVSGRLSR
ncbi:MAG: MFS transporter [Aeromicrobium sp.]